MTEQTPLAAGALQVLFRDCSDRELAQAFETREISDEALLWLIETEEKSVSEKIAETARFLAGKYYGCAVYMRGLIEFTNYCRNNCFYCGIRRDNETVERYRLTKEQILACCHSGYELGFRTFVLQGGEDDFFTDEKICEIVSAIRREFPDCAITLSVGEREKESYRRFFEAGADRFLLRQETSTPEHYRKLHPKEMSMEHRQQCLWDLKELGFQVGCGLMVGSPFQTDRDLLGDLRFMQRLKPQMIGIGPFIPSEHTPFGTHPGGTLEKSLRMVSILRLLFPKALIPATTALGTIRPDGREEGILAGANVVMPNLSPVDVRKKYLLYDNKICTGDEAAECRQCLQRRVEGIGYELVVSKGNPADWKEKKEQKS